MFERFTDRARKVMALANQEANRFNHEYIGTEHIFLALVKEGNGIGATILKNLDMDLKKLRIEMEKLIKSGADAVVTEKLPQTPRAKRVVEYAMEEARALNHNYVGTEHILLGLMRETEGIAAQVLMNLGLKLADVRQEVLNLLGAGVENEGRGGEKTGMSEKEVLEIIEEAARDGRTELNLSRSGITSLPRAVGELRNLARLYLYSNQLMSLPPEIGKLTKLTMLDLGNNQLAHVPAEVGNLTELQVLDLRDNRLVTVPSELGKLTKLKELELHGNPLESLLAELADQGTKAVLEYLRTQWKWQGDPYVEGAYGEGAYGEGAYGGGKSKSGAELEVGSVREIPGFEFGEGSKGVMNAAWEVASGIDSQIVELRSSALLFGIEDFGERQKIHNSSWFLFKAMKDSGRSRSVRSRYVESRRLELESRFMEKRAEPRYSVTDHTVGLLSKAKEIAVATAGLGVIHCRHLVAGILLYGDGTELSGAQHRLGEMELQRKTLCEDFADFLRWADLNDDREAWEEILGGSGEVGNEGEAAAEELGSYHAPIAAFSGDGVRDAEGRLVDQLGIEAEVNAMSSLVAACDIKWPLSIGLFGDWGSGKSFFMEMMRERVERISEESCKWVGAGNESAYCTNVVQIRFNAWHYMDANLWASLVTHIFEELAGQMSGDKEGDLARTKETLFGQLESAKELKKEAQEKKRKATELRKEAEDNLAKAEKEKADAAQELTNLTGRDVVALAKEDPRIREQFAEIADALGLEKIAPAADDLREVISQGRDLFGRVSLIWRTISSRRKGKIKLLEAIGLILGLPVLVGLVAWWVSDSAFAAQLTGVIGIIGSVITGHIKALKPRLVRIGKGLAQWEKTQEEIRRISAKKTQQQTEEELRIWREIENLKERERAAEEDVERAERLEDEASEELEEIKTGRRLFRFIEERSRKSEYKEKLGIIALIREDFELLSKLVCKSSEEAAGDDLPRVDRIVLYIDDLDRCTSERVVEVLQAVHLILAFELFVVVVAVDSRWILHALYEEYSAFGGVDKVSARLGSRWLTTPQNYVEKIFQIPFALRPMGDRGYRQLVGKLVESEGRKDGEAMGKEREVMAHEGREEQGLEHEITQREEKKIQTEKSSDKVEGKKGKPDEFEPTIEMKPPSANLSEQEAEFMKAMGDLIPSPRAAKRFVNIYRLTLASVDDGGKLAELRGTENRPGDYQAVLLMLAILTGFPGQGADILKILANGGGKCDGILDFVSKLKTRKEPKSDPVRYRNGVRKGILEAERAVWDRLSNILKERIKELGVRDSLEPFVRWAGWVARFSFQYKTEVVVQTRPSI